MTLSRRDMVRVSLGVGAGLALGARPTFARQTDLLMRPIHSSGEMLPAMGIGTAVVYDVGTSETERGPLRDVLREMPRLGARLIDTAPAYGNAEVTVGDLTTELGNRDDLFFATKVGSRARQGREATPAMDQIEASFRRLKTDFIDLIQVWNLIDTDDNLRILRDLREAGRIRYIGITTSSYRQYEDFERVMRTEDLDFVQINYSLATRRAEERLLPLAQDRGISVLCNLPFGRGRLFRTVGDRPLPDWASEFGAETWAQFFLKYILSHPAVTAPIPGTDKVEYLKDNVAAATAVLPSEEHRAAMREFFDALPQPEGRGQG